MIMKLDLKKAYDNVEWTFFEQAFGAWGFFGKANDLILSCVTTINYNMLINGNMAGQMP